MKTPPCFKGLVSYSYHIKVQGNLAVHKKILTRGMHTGYSWPSLTFDSLFFLVLGDGLVKWLLYISELSWCRRTVCCAAQVGFIAPLLINISVGSHLFPEGFCCCAKSLNGSRLENFSLLKVSIQGTGEPYRGSSPTTIMVFSWGGNGTSFYSVTCGLWLVMSSHSKR